MKFFLSYLVICSLTYTPSFPSSNVLIYLTRPIQSNSSTFNSLTNFLHFLNWFVHRPPFSQGRLPHWSYGLFVGPVTSFVPLFILFWLKCITKSPVPLLRPKIWERLKTRFVPTLGVIQEFLSDGADDTTFPFCHSVLRKRPWAHSYFHPLGLRLSFPPLFIDWNPI